ncbi:casein kinase [Ceratobasidium sp. AG-Ba]|nr:casein kinase [Ceratobasidium sp. AG-Ba]QRW11290.1 casein kinase [Ceratobasidium sp. AG-Ba]
MSQTPGSTRICLIDFGIAYRVPTDLYPKEPHDSQVPLGVTGTLPYASINAHDVKVKLTYRDDLESLSYTLIWLLRGSLPWTYLVYRGTYIGRIRQVYEQKKRLTGTAMAAGLPAEFAELVDYARNLPPDEIPSYGLWQERLKQLQEVSKDIVVPPLQPSGIPSLAPSKVDPVQVGQIVLVKINPEVTVEGYTMRAGHEGSHVQDPRFEDPEWAVRPRPAIITQIQWNEEKSMFSLEAVAISRRSNAQISGIDSVRLGILQDQVQSGSSGVVISGPTWPYKDSFCYVFKDLLKFRCLPQQVPISSTWRISLSDVDLIQKKIFPSLDREKDRYSEDPDIRHDTRMRSSYFQLYAKLLPLNQDNFEDEPIDWFSNRAWFDECIKACRLHDMYGFRWWTGAWFPRHYIPKEGELDSYSGTDFQEWDRPQQNRDTTIRQDLSGQNGGCEGDLLDGVEKIIALEVDV